MDPATIALISSAVSSAIKSGQDRSAKKKEKKASKKRSKELKRETLANLLNDSLYGSSELYSHGLSSKSKMSKRKSNSMQDTADLVRGAFSI